MIGRNRIVPLMAALAFGSEATLGWSWISSAAAAVCCTGVCCTGAGWFWIVFWAGAEPAASRLAWASNVPAGSV
ncbi:hypothetical protein D9M72_309310 [compost metagenome]